MPWILTGERETFTAATITAEEEIHDLTTVGGGPDAHRLPVVHLDAVIIHHPNGDKTPVQTYTLHGAGAYEITWTPAPSLVQDDDGMWCPVDPQSTT